MIVRLPVRTAGLAALALLLLVSGCFKLSRQAPQVQYFVLAGASATPATTTGTALSSTSATAAATGLTVGLRRVDLASYLSSDPGMVVRHGASRLTVSEFHQWAGELGEGINRAVAAHLVGVATVRAVNVAPWPTRAQHDFIVQLHVSRFEGVVDSSATATDGRVHVLTDWDIVRPLDNAVLLRGTTNDREGSFRVGDYAALATALDAALARVARDIGTCLARFPNDSTPPATCGPAAR